MRAWLIAGNTKDFVEICPLVRRRFSLQDGPTLSQ